MTPKSTGPILEFRPWVTWARTILYEYFCMNWAARIAAERTTHSPLAARLVGESFELAFKVLHTLSQGPERELKFGHSLGELIRHMGQLERLLRDLWGGNLDDHMLSRAFSGALNLGRSRFPPARRRVVEDAAADQLCTRSSAYTT